MAIPHPPMPPPRWPLRHPPTSAKRRLQFISRNHQNQRQSQVYDISSQIWLPQQNWKFTAFYWKCFSSFCLCTTILQNVQSACTHVENYKFYTTSTLYSRRQSKKIEMVCLFWDMLLYFSKIKKMTFVWKLKFLKVFIENALTETVLCTCVCDEHNTTYITFSRCLWEY